METIKIPNFKVLPKEHEKILHEAISELIKCRTLVINFVLLKHFNLNATEKEISNRLTMIEDINKTMVFIDYKTPNKKLIVSLWIDLKTSKMKIETDKGLSRSEMRSIKKLLS
jgi:hypothetical protein